jgi:phage recombination protein Bet
MNEIQKRDERVTDLALIKRTVAPNATDDQLALFLHDCQRRGVHPLDKLIVFTNAGGKYTPITTIDYMRSRAAESGEMAGSDDAVFVERTAGKPATATVTVHRITNGTKYSYTATARYDEYYRNTPTWNHMPHTMLAKCAEALALRKAFPHQLHGLYTREEMQQAITEDELENIARNEKSDPEEMLRQAAESGWLALREAWSELPYATQSKLKKKLDDEFKPIAIEVDKRALGADESVASAPEGGGTVSAADLPHGSGNRPADSDEEAAAYSRGQADRRKGAAKRAMPGEYRDKSKLAIAWTRGWDDGAIL